jgi:hypothetical protein
MTMEDIHPTAEGLEMTTGPSPARPTALPPNCNPDQFLNWRLKYALHLTDYADGSRITHDDPWVQAMIDFRLVAQFHHRPPTETELAIHAATQLFASDSLAKHVLEARLLAQETPEEISARCELSPLIITAYSKLHFDVCGRERKAIWLMRPLASAVVADTEVARLGRRLKNLACFSSGEELERHISTLQRIEGGTLAAGLSEGGNSAWTEEIAQRLAVANHLLPMSRTAQRSLQQFVAAAAGDVQAQRTSPASIDLAMNVLRRVRIPAGIQRELRTMREPLVDVRRTTDVVSA